MNSIGTILSNQSFRESDPAELSMQQTQAIFHMLCRITGNREDAEDAMQDAFLRALEHLEDFGGRASFSTWFTRIAINSALMILRKRKNTRTVSLDGPSASQEIRDPTPDAEQRYLQTEREKTVRDAIEELRPSLRSVLEVGHLGERSMRETAEIIGVSVGATKARLFHARTALRKSRKLRSFATGRASHNRSWSWLSDRIHRSSSRNLSCHVKTTQRAVKDEPTSKFHIARAIRAYSMPK